MRRHWRVVSISLAVTSIVLAWAATLLAVPPTWLELSAFSVSAIFVVFTIIVIVPRIMQARVDLVPRIAASMRAEGLTVSGG